ncbi:MAG TPA: hypothetical protein PLC42_00850 [Parachlamydiaceae bacterium]|nr:hypothetical protein [Parachlamydiaceae bacterium]
MDPATVSSSKYIEQMTQKQIKKVEKRMRPGSLSAAGFLTNEQSLVNLISQDIVIS